ncbi:MAG: hypothetical protein A3D67_01215 [Candidatus Lloydbacteria bacterium RIFCSPHIGHO2_02_FULL_51_22]|uniref:Uncharacterized protein n=1 Tax=Candidatus Lloydbacteria bacterium RIFCSPHIGHO2_02_FULL_51_22 TaxID=1798663 RepID=A0A1G2D6H6_9BACT|nr:MAG: hypothetical protein A3D67_01215 [Candidatus Lloydbacteria bacterium RIFCSPHIGHO2_02_FULL_51_22]
MQEGFPKKDGGGEMEQEESFETLIARIREEFANALDRHADAVGGSFAESFHAFSKNVREGKPIRINGPIESDILDSILGFGGLGLKNYGPGSEKYRAIWSALEQGQ